MSAAFDIRPSHAGDLPAISSLYRNTFPNEDLLPLVAALLSEETGVLSLVCLRDAALVGHVACTDCAVEGHQSSVALLGPLAVGKSVQKQGLGSALVREGLAQLTKQGVGSVYVLGDPRYYGLFGFAPEVNLLPPYKLVEEWRSAWQSLRLGAAVSQCQGRLSVPAPWRRPDLWAP